VIDGAVGGNESRFINHSCAPNCQAVSEGQRVFIEALTTIEPGTELVYDYAYARTPENDNPESEALYACRCGAPTCRGSILEPPRRVPARASRKAAVAKQGSAKQGAAKKGGAGRKATTERKASGERAGAKRGAAKSPAKSPAKGAVTRGASGRKPAATGGALEKAAPARGGGTRGAAEHDAPAKGAGGTRGRAKTARQATR
jgi:hypothetical protein